MSGPPRRTTSRNRNQNPKSPRSARSPRRGPGSATSPRGPTSPRSTRSTEPATFDLDLPTLGKTILQLDASDAEYLSAVKVFLCARYQHIRTLTGAYRRADVLTKAQWVQFWTDQDGRGVDVMKRKVAAKIFDTYLDKKKKKKVGLGEVEKLGKTMQKEWNKLASRGETYLSQFSWWDAQLEAQREAEVHIAPPPPLDEIAAIEAAEEKDEVKEQETAEPVSPLDRSDVPPNDPPLLKVSSDYELKIRGLEADAKRRQSQVSELVAEFQKERERHEAEVNTLRQQLATRNSEMEEMKQTYESRLDDLTNTHEESMAELVRTSSSDASGAQKAIAALQSEVRNHNEQNLKSKELLNNLQEELVAAKDALAELHRTEQQQAIRISDLTQELEMLKENDTQAQIISELRAENAQLAEKLLEYKAVIRQNDERETTQSLAVHNSTAEVADMKTVLKNKNKEIAKLQEFIETMKDETRKSLEAVAKEANKDNRRLARQVVDLKADIRHKEEEVVDLRDQLDHLKSRGKRRRRRDDEPSSRRGSFSRSETITILSGEPSYRREDSTSRTMPSMKPSNSMTPTGDSSFFPTMKSVDSLPPLAATNSVEEKTSEPSGQAQQEVEIQTIPGSDAWGPAEFLNQFVQSLEDNKGAKGTANVSLIITLLRMGMNRADLQFDINTRVKKKRSKGFVVSTKETDETLFIKVVSTENHQVVDEFMRMPGLNVNLASKKYGALACAISKRDKKLVQDMLGRSRDFDLNVGFNTAGSMTPCIDYAKQLGVEAEVIAMLEAYAR